MAIRKKTLKKTTKSKKAAGKKPTATKTARRAKKPAKKKVAPKQTPKKKTSSKKPAPKQIGRRGVAAPSRKRRVSLAGQQSGDLQGLSRRETADSESVDELLEEGNAFEAGAVMGVEDANSMDEREVHTREVPEDDVPGEYLDED